jgi:multisubunit Na+/H+ antiporter MnhB subunit
MIDKIKRSRVIYIIGVIALVIGSLDPLEGSVVIAIGTALLSLATYLSQDKHWRIFLLSFVLIIIGVIFLFYFSSLGGFGGNSTLSWWWGTLILPYPIGWLISMILLIARLVKKKKQETR